MRAMAGVALVALLIGCGDGGDARPAPPPTPLPGAARLSLDGTWRFRADPDDVGLAQRWFDPATATADWRDAPVPGNWNFLFRDTPYPSTDHDYEGVAWYRRSVDLPAGSAAPLALLHFEAVHYRATVWVNGIEVGSHEGDFLPFEFDVTAALRPGTRNDIVLRVESLTATPGETVPPERGRYDYWIYAGIHRSVWLESFAAVGIHDLAVRADPTAAGGGVIRGELSLFNVADRAVEGAADVEVVDAEGEPVARLAGNLTLPPRTLVRAPFLLSAAAVRPWSPAAPALYECRARVSTSPGTTDVRLPTTVLGPFPTAGPLPPHATLRGPSGVDRRVTIGFRRVEADGERILLNGEPILFQGVNRHDEYPLLGRVLPDDLYESDLAAMKAVGVNAIRSAHYPNDPRLYDLTDRLGFLVVEEVPAIGLERADFASPRVLALAREQAVAMARRDANHPSIVIWSVGNEPFPTGNADFNSALYQAIRAEAIGTRADQPRLLSYARGQVDNVNPDPDGDLVMLNPYFGWYTGAIEGLDRFLEQTRRKFPDRPILLSEFGADAVPGRRTNADPAAAPHFTEDFQAYYLSETWRIVRSKPWVSGGFVWAFADFLSPTREYLRSLQFIPPSARNPVPFHNLKGILSNDRRPKNAYLTVRGMYGDRALVDLAIEAVDAGAAAVAGAEVLVRDPVDARPLAGGTTDASGRLALWRIPAGTYRVEVSGREAARRAADRSPATARRCGSRSRCRGGAPLLAGDAQRGQRALRHHPIRSGVPRRRSARARRRRRAAFSAVSARTRSARPAGTRAVAALVTVTGRGALVGW
ncbi:MAG: glycoside hydrolase family 2 TIM barrel-domain containing protein [Candidatus Binatia bacterium]